MTHSQLPQDESDPRSVQRSGGTAVPRNPLPVPPHCQALSPRIHIPEGLVLPLAMALQARQGIRFYKQEV